MSGISPKLPLQTDNTYGSYLLNKTFREATKQNLKNLILTNPGERVMDPSFGVGLRTLLFEMNDVALRGAIEAKILKQVEFYMPHVEILDIIFFNDPIEELIPANSLAVRLVYKLLPINDDDILDISVE